MSEYLNVKECTPGPWGIRDEVDDFDGYLIDRIEKREKRRGYSCYEQVAAVGGCDAGTEQKANARLIAEAGTVAHESGMSPREMWDAMKEIAKGIHWCKATAWSDEDGMFVEDVRKELNRLDFLAAAILKGANDAKA